MTCLHICNDFMGSKVHAQLFNEINKLDYKQIVYFILKPHLIEKVRNSSSKWNYEVIPSALTKRKHSYLYKSKLNYLYKDILNKVDIKNLDVINASTLFADGGLALRLYRDFGIPYSVSVRATDIDIYLKYRPDLAFFAYKILKNANQIVFISPSLKRKFENHYLIKLFFSKFQHKTSVVYNGVDEFWLKERRSIKTLSSPFKVLYVGRLILRKNILSICEAIKKMNENNILASLTIVGHGPMEKEIVDLSNTNPNFIKYVGSITDKKTLKTYYENHHVFAMPSLGETFGLVYLEALSQNTPVIYTIGEAIDGVFTEDVGEACLPSVDGIYNALLKILNNYQRFKIDEIDLSQFNWNHIGKRYHSLFHKIVTNP